MNKRHYEHTLPNIRGSLSNTYGRIGVSGYWNAPGGGGLVSLTDTFRLQSNGY